MVVTTTPAQPTPDRVVIDLTGEDDPDIVYPSISELLAELDETMPALRISQYEDRLFTAGFRHVHQIIDTPAVHAMLENLGIPIGVVEEIIDRASRMTRRAAKSKSTMKCEDDSHGGF